MTTIEKIEYHTENDEKYISVIFNNGSKHKIKINDIPMLNDSINNKKIHSVSEARNYKPDLNINGIYDTEEILKPYDLHDYEHVNHPNHYNTYDVEVIEMMERIWGPEKTAIWCEMTAFKYRLRMGTKPDNDILQDLNKEKWYLNKFNELKRKINHEYK